MTNIVEKVIKLCDKICSGEYPLQKLYSYGVKGFGTSKIHFRIDDGSFLCIDTAFGVSKEIPLDKIEECKLVIAFTNVKNYAESLVENVLDDCLNAENHKISNVNELDCNN